MTDNGIRFRRAPYVQIGHAGHVEEVVGRMRRADTDEVAAATGKDPDEMLRRSYYNSLHKWAIIWRGETVAVFGLAPLSLTGVRACPWLLGTDKLAEIKLSFLRHGDKYLYHMLKLYPVLCNYVDARNEVSIKWLTWLGFTVNSEPVPYGPAGLPFYYFEKTREGYYV